jgi:hypothetical protein
MSSFPARRTGELIICWFSKMISTSKNIIKRACSTRFSLTAQVTGPKTSMLAVSAEKLTNSVVRKFATTWSPYVYLYTRPHSLVLKLAVGICNRNGRTKRWSGNGDRMHSALYADNANQPTPPNGRFSRHYKAYHFDRLSAAAF